MTFIIAQQKNYGWRISHFRAADAREFLSGKGLDVDAIAPLVDGKFFSGFIRAKKPAACCGPACCA